MNEMTEEVMQTIFKMFAEAEGSKDGKLSRESIKKLLKEGGIINKNAGITEADVDAAYDKTCKDKKGLGFADHKEFIKALAEGKKVEPKELIEKVAATVEEEVYHVERPEDGELSPESVKKILKEVGVIGKDTGITEAELDAALTKIGKEQKGIVLADLKELIKALVEEKKVEPKKLIIKVAEAVQQEVQGSEASKIKFSSGFVKTLLKEVGAFGKDAVITEADVDAAFAKTCKEENGLKLADHKEFIKALAKEKKVEPKELIEKVAATIELEASQSKRPEDEKLSPESVKKLLKKVGVIDKDTEITEAELDAAFAKIGKEQKGIVCADLKELIKALAEEKKVEPKKLITKVAEAVVQDSQGSKASKMKLSSEFVKTLFKEVGAFGKDSGITESDVDAAFAKTCKEENGLKLADHKEFVKALAKEKKVKPKELIERVAAAVELEVSQAGGPEDERFSPESVKKILKKVGVIGKDTEITDALIDAAFAKIGKEQKGIVCADLKELIKALAEEKKIEPKKLIVKVAEAVVQDAQESKASKMKFASDFVKTLFKEVGAFGKNSGITESDVEAAFAKISKEENGLKVADHKEFIKALAEGKKVKPNKLIKSVAKAVAQEIAKAGAKHDGIEKEK